MGDQKMVLPDSAKEQPVHSSGRTGAPHLRFLHFNDVYHLDAGSSEPVGGLARFQTLANYYASDAEFAGLPDLITLFSGDVFNPSLESTVTKGSHMVPVLNQLRVDCSCIGNHDLDFGVPQFERLASKCSFPWLLANVLDPALGNDVPLGNARKTVMLTASNGLKVGLIGLAEREWLVTVNSLPPDLIYQSASETAKRLASELREQGADIVIAITHQREPNDNKLAEKVPAGLLDMVLGGHDHFYGHSLINGTHVLRSGTDFRNMSYIQAWKKPGGGWDIDIARRDVVRAIPRDDTAAALVEKISSGLRSKLEKPIGYTAAALDARFMTVRLKESNIGNFVCDLMRLFYGADCTIMASGTIRGDQVYPPGLLKSKDIMNCFPFEDPVVVLKVKGSAIQSALENGVSQYPALEGRFPQVSNIKFEFDPRQPAGSRITKPVRIGAAPLDPGRDYILATRDYMARGKDGFDALLYRELGGSAEPIVSDENGILISMLLRQYFMSLRTLGLWRMPHVLEQKSPDSLRAHFHARVHDSLHGAHPVKSPAPSPLPTPLPTAAPPPLQTTPHNSTDTAPSDDEDEDDPLGPNERRGHAHTSADPHDATTRRLALARRVLRKWARLANLADRLHIPDEQGEGEFAAAAAAGAPSGREWMGWTRAVAPRVEGRIVCVGA